MIILVVKQLIFFLKISSIYYLTKVVHKNKKTIILTFRLVLQTTKQTCQNERVSAHSDVQRVC